MSRFPHLTCDDVEPLLPVVADGQVDETSDPALFAHLAECEHCANRLLQHDLITLAIEHQTTAKLQPIVPPIRFPRLRRWLPLASAAAIVITLGASIGTHFRSPAADQTLTHNTTTAPIDTRPRPLNHPSTVDPLIEVEVITIHGSTPGHPHYLVRRGEQILLIDPSVIPTAPVNAVSASYAQPSANTTRRY